MKKIIIIENEYVHFKVISETLAAHGFNVFPIIDKDEDITLRNFREFMDPIRIIIGQGYRYELQKRAFAKVNSFINNVSPDLIIIEYKLSSNDEALSGINLATDLRENNEAVPIMFLTQTPFNNMNVVKNIGHIRPPFKWVAKGYSDEIFSKDYFDETIINQINSMMMKE